MYPEKKNNQNYVIHNIKLNSIILNVYRKVF